MSHPVHGDRAATPINGQIWRLHNAIRDAAESWPLRDPAPKKAMEKALAVIRLFADWVAGFEEHVAGFEGNDHNGALAVHSARVWAGFGDDDVRLRLKAKYTQAWACRCLVKELRVVVGHVLAGKRSSAELTIEADRVREALKQELQIAGESFALSVIGHEPRYVDFTTAYRTSNPRRLPRLRKQYQGEPRYVFNNGRPKKYRDDVQAVLDAVRQSPGGIGIRGLCRMTRMRTATVTAAYKQLVADGVLRQEPAPRGGIRLFPKPNPLT